MSMNVAVESVSAPAEIPLDGMQKLRLQSADPESRTDSGYFTQTPTPDRNSKQSSRSSSNAVDRLTTQTRVLRSSTNPLQELSEFDIQVDAATISRFSNIQPQIERALLKYVHKTPGKFRAMAIRLMVLGASAAQAKPHIVVLVAEEQYKRARKFFDKSSVQSLVRPRDETLPSFEVLIYARPPEQKQAEHDNIDVLIPMINGDLGFTTETFCGAPIIIRHLSGAEKRATFGGIIKVVDQHGNLKLYGLTAGHVVGDSDDYVSVQSSSDMNPRDDDLVLSDSEPESESESDTDCDVDELENLSNKSSKQSHDAATSWDQGDKVLMFQDSNTAWSSVELRSMGMISKDSPQMHDQSDEQTPDVQAYLDWALIDMSTYKPNHLRPRARGFDDSTNPVQSTSGDLVKPLSKSSYKGVRRSVVVISGSEGPKRGTISALPSRILLGPGKEFVDTLVVNLDAGKEIVDGDSGSWVVNERSREVYGHIVAADAFGGGYIMPLDDTLLDIKTHLRAKSVDVASLVDIAIVAMEKMATENATDIDGGEEPLPKPLLNSIASLSPFRPINLADISSRSPTRMYGRSNNAEEYWRPPRRSSRSPFREGGRRRRGNPMDHLIETRLELGPQRPSERDATWGHAPVVVVQSPELNFNDSGYSTRRSSAKSSAGSSARSARATWRRVVVTQPSEPDFIDSGYGTARSSAKSSRATSDTLDSAYYLPHTPQRSPSGNLDSRSRHNMSSRPEVKIEIDDSVYYTQPASSLRRRSLTRNDVLDERLSERLNKRGEEKVEIDDSAHYSQPASSLRQRSLTQNDASDEEIRQRLLQRITKAGEEKDAHRQRILSEIERANAAIASRPAVPIAPQSLNTRQRQGEGREESSG